MKQSIRWEALSSSFSNQTAQLLSNNIKQQYSLSKLKKKKFFYKVN